MRGRKPQAEALGSALRKKLSWPSPGEPPSLSNHTRRSVPYMYGGRESNYSWNWLGPTGKCY